MHSIVNVCLSHALPAAFAAAANQMSLHDASKVNLESLAFKWAKAIRKKRTKKMKKRRRAAGRSRMLRQREREKV